jgi:O-antigen/teichoic acid export membrane protein
MSITAAPLRAKQPGSTRHEGHFHSLFKGGLRLGSGQVIVQLCSFVRNLIVARMISVQDYGVAAAFAMMFSLLELISSLALDKLLIQSPDGDEHGLQRTAQFIQAIRGLSNGAVLFLLGGLAARLFGISQAAWSFRALALLPVLRGFSHFDTVRMQRGLRFGPTVTVDIGSNLFVTLLAWPIVAWLKDYRAMLVILVLQSVATLIGSHAVAERRYCWSYDRAYARRIFAFSWPLLINGMLLFVILEGDRFVIGSSRQVFSGARYTLADLGQYSLAFSLVMAPAMFVANVTSSLFLPVLSKFQSIPAQFQRGYQRVFSVHCLAAVLIVIPFMLAGPKVIVWIYGVKYTASGAVVGWIAAMWGLRVVRQAPTIAALAHADTKASMTSNFIRCLSLVGCLFAAATGKGVVWIAISGLGGELLALPWIMLRVRNRLRLPLRVSFPPLAIAGLGVLATAALVYFGLPQAVAPLTIGSAVAATAVTALLLAAFVPSLRGDLRSFAVSAFGIQGAGVQAWEASVRLARRLK